MGDQVAERAAGEAGRSCGTAADPATAIRKQARPKGGGENPLNGPVNGRAQSPAQNATQDPAQSPAQDPAPAVSAKLRERIDRYQDRVRGWQGTHLLHGPAAGPGDVVVASNDYLALAGDRRIAKAMADCLTSGDDGALLASAAFLHGDHPQLRLERDLARFLRAPAGVLCQSGWDANLGLLQAIADPTTPVYVDLLAHMSLWSGARLAGAPVHPFRHNDPVHLRRQIDRHGPGVIAVDSLYSTNGSLCPLERMCDVAAETGCTMVVDESHSLGVYGPGGAGLVVGLGLTGRVHFRVASLSKAFAGRAGYVAACDPGFVGYFKLNSFPAVFSSMLLPHDVAGLAAALDIVAAEPWRRDRLHRLAARLRREIGALGFDLQDSAGQIIALQTGPDRHAIKVRDLLAGHGVFGSVFCPPATPRNRTLIRLSLHAALTDGDADRIIAACRAVRDAHGAAPPRRGAP
ncbi:alpha-hydroxyketone-type quorum-sensing autoinducer synthase [Spirillospora sp. NPDC050679]